MEYEELLEELDAEARAQLERYHFDAATFLELREAFLGGELSAESNRIDAEIALPGDGDIRDLPEPDGAGRARLAEIGREAIEDGQVGIVVLNGGMATRFGGVVKGCVEVTDGYSFLGIKLRDIGRYDRTRALLMNSFATADLTTEHLEAHDHFEIDAVRVDSFPQNISLRLTPDGALFRDEDGHTSPYAPGHGDLPEALGRGALERFVEAGGRVLLMSNVDNVLASLDPAIIGAHLEASRERDVEMTVECVERYEGDSGGMPARVDGHLQVVEAFRFPEGFDTSTIPVFNTNTFVFDAEALQRDFDLSWFVVEKEVDGRTAIQFERLAGELSAFLETQFLSVPRQGSRSRFLPIKRPSDLDGNRAYLREVLRERSIL